MKRNDLSIKRVAINDSVDFAHLANQFDKQKNSQGVKRLNSMNIKIPTDKKNNTPQNKHRYKPSN